MPAKMPVIFQTTAQNPNPQSLPNSPQTLLTRNPTFAVIEKGKGFVTQRFPVHSGYIFYDAAQ